MLAYQLREQREGPTPRRGALAKHSPHQPGPANGKPITPIPTQLGCGQRGHPLRDQHPPQGPSPNSCLLAVPTVRSHNPCKLSNTVGLSLSLHPARVPLSSTAVMQERAASNVLPPEGQGPRGGSWGEVASPTWPRAADAGEAAGASAPRTGARPRGAGSSCAAAELRSRAPERRSPSPQERRREFTRLHPRSEDRGHSGSAAGETGTQEQRLGPRAVIHGFPETVAEGDRMPPDQVERRSPQLVPPVLLGDPGVGVQGHPITLALLARQSPLPSTVRS